MRIRTKYVNQLVSLLASFGSLNYDCWCLKTNECPCDECQSVIDQADKFIDKLHKLKVIGDDLRVIKPKRAVMK